MFILVADDHPIFRDAIALLTSRAFPNLDVKHAASLEDALQLIEIGTPQLLILDFYMPGMSVAALRSLAQQFPMLPVLVVSGGLTSEEVGAVLKAGASGFLSKCATHSQFVVAMSSLLSGGKLQSIGTAAQTGPPLSTEKLSPREVAVLEAVAHGKANKVIARELELAEITVKMHLSAIFRKLGVRSRTEAALKFAANSNAVMKRHT